LQNKIHWLFLLRFVKFLFYFPISIGLVKSPKQGQHIVIQIIALGAQHEQHPPLRNKFSARYFEKKYKTKKIYTKKVD
jgi:hypothetical protein